MKGHVYWGQTSLKKKIILEIVLQVLEGGFLDDLKQVDFYSPDATNHKGEHLVLNVSQSQFFLDSVVQLMTF